MDGVECSTPVKQIGSCCSAYDACSRKWKKEDKVHFHSYPLKDKHRLAKWLAAIKRDDFKPTTASRICGDHFITSDYHPGSRELKKLGLKFGNSLSTRHIEYKKNKMNKMNVKIACQTLSASVADSN